MLLGIFKEHKDAHIKIYKSANQGLLNHKHIDPCGLQAFREDALVP